MKSTLEFDSIQLEFGLHKVLSSVAMKCETGEVVGLLGRNGSGKSSLMKIVFGSMSSEFRSVRIDKVPVIGNAFHKRQISYLTQEALIPSYLSIRKAMNYFGVSEESVCGAFPPAKEVLNLKPNQCSGGTLRIIETLLVLLSPASFCILDEPFSGVMPVHIESIKEIIQKQKQHKGIIITDHLYRHVTDIADRMYVLSNGQTCRQVNK
jgi:ABC-type lipopolysaccharide export system ATPase subunit